MISFFILLILFLPLHLLIFLPLLLLLFPLLLFLPLLLLLFLPLLLLFLPLISSGRLKFNFGANPIGGGFAPPTPIGPPLYIPSAPSDLLYENHYLVKIISLLLFLRKLKISSGRLKTSYGKPRIP